jgi:hypothetical protein
MKNCSVLNLVVRIETAGLEKDSLRCDSVIKETGIKRQKDKWLPPVTADVHIYSTLKMEAVFSSETSLRLPITQI